MKKLFLILVVLSSSCGVSVHRCTEGTEGVDTAIEFYSEVAPEVVDNLEIMCADTHRIQSPSLCGFGRSEEERKNTTSCMMHVGNGPYPARMHIDNSTDTALGVCHELQHARPSVWKHPNACESHLKTCGYDEEMVKRCGAAVWAARGLDYEQ